ncbi:MAG: hypothetical protein KDI56_14260, partial [Xanthomonadales bacterium]|nr:hypothetical protein [Xanthomonadales bacterium]
MKHLIFVLGLLLAPAASPMATTAPTSPLPAVLTELLAPWNRTDGPGVSLAVSIDGTTVSRQVGMADLEQGRP